MSIENIIALIFLVFICAAVLVLIIPFCKLNEALINERRQNEEYCKQIKLLKYEKACMKSKRSIMALEGEAKNV